MTDAAARTSKDFAALFRLAVAAMKLEPFARSMQGRHEAAVELVAEEGVLDEEESNEETLFGAEFAGAHTALTEAWKDLPEALKAEIQAVVKRKD